MNSIRISLAVIAMVTVTSFWVACSKNSKEYSEQNTENISNITLEVFEPVSAVSFNRSEVESVPALCGTSTVKSFINNSTSYGTISVGNDATDYYITISCNGSWSLKDISLYAGSDAGIPVNNGGMAQHNQFPVQKSYNSPCPGSWSLKIPIADLGNAFSISVRTNFMSPSGSTTAVWSEGSMISSPRPPTKFSFTEQVCIIDEGCAWGQGYWFGNGNQSWPDVNGTTDGSVTIGYENYTRDEARAIWWANNGQCPGIPDAKKAFAFVAAIKLSGASVIGNVELWAEVAAADVWLASLERLSPDNICDQPVAPEYVKDAVAGIGAWLDAHECE